MLWSGSASKYAPGAFSLSGKPKGLTQGTLYQFMETANIRNGINLDLFRILVERGNPVSLTELASITKADPVLLGIDTQNSKIISSFV